ncbi:MAG: type II toxin-antitoxin system VapC family toxin [Chitinophagaceae bacterium]|nr:type II toxin-antitoxin system VapC family toxin [Chitinophagaceae bacterium]
MKLSLVDTDVLSAFLRGDEQVAKRVELYLKKFSHLNISIITYYEMLNGLLYKDARKQLSRFESFIKLNKVYPLTLRSVKISAGIQAELRRNGSPIGHTDTLIAGIALANKMTLISNNSKHFSRIDKLDIDNWLK